MADQPDTRVRLSAEGVDEVIRAFRRIQQEWVKTSKVVQQNQFDIGAALAGRQQPSSGAPPIIKLPPVLKSIGQTSKSAAVGIEAMATSIGARLAPSLVGIGTGVGAAIIGIEALSVAFRLAGRAVSEFAALVSGSIDEADAIGKLAQKTGLASETLSVFSFAAKTADADLGTLDTGLRGFQKTMAAYDKGADTAADATLALFGSAKALEGLKSDERLLKVVKALAALGPEYNRVGIAEEFFGRGARDLLPLIDDLGGEGFEKLRKEAEKLGLVFDDKATSAARRANDAIERMKTIAQGLANQFAAGLVPALADVGEGFNNAFGGEGVNAMNKLGEVSGKVLKELATDLFLVSLEIEEFIRKWKEFLSVPSLSLKRNPVGQVKQLLSNLDQINKDIQERFNNFFDPDKGKDGDGKNKGDGTGLFDAGDKAKKVADARLKFEQSRLDQELALIQAQLKLRGAAEQAALDDTLDAIARHFSQRRTQAEDEAQAEIDILRKRENLIASTPVGKDEAARIERDTQLAEIHNQILVREIELRRNLRGISQDHQKAVVAAQKTQEEARAEQVQRIGDEFAEAQEQREKARELQRDIEAELFELQGDRHQAELLRIEKEAEAKARELKALGVEQREIDETIARLREKRLQELDNKELDAIAEINKRQLLSQGKRHEARLIEIQREAEVLRREIQANEPDFEKRSGRVDEFVRVQTAIANLDHAKDSADQVFRDIAARREEINADVARGTLFQFEADRQILQMERSRLPVLQELARNARDAAEATGDPAALEQALQLTAAIRDLAIQTDLAAQQAAQFKATIEDSATGALADFFADGVTGAESLSDAFKGMAASIVQDLRRIAAQMLATLIIQKTLRAAFGIVGAAAGGVDPLGGGGAQGFASGGLVRGPGTGTSDSIHAMLSAGEFVIRKSVVDDLGVDFFKALNTLRWTPKALGGVPRFAEGGLVGEAAGGGSFTGEVGIRIEDDAISARIIRNPKFRDGVLKIINENPKAFGAALGRR